MLENFTKEKRVGCLHLLREARALVLRDAESFHDAAIALEQVGQIMTNEVRNGLGRYKDDLLKLAQTIGIHDSSDVARLFAVVKDARNMAVHEGAWARHLNTRLIDLFLILEDALMAELTLVGDIMVRNPVVAEPWQIVAQVRKLMLANSFSCLPILLTGKWMIVSDFAVMQFLRGATSKSQKDEFLSTPIQQAIEAKKIAATRAVCCSADEPIEHLSKKLRDRPVLVTHKAKKVAYLDGIVMPFDLL